MAEMIAAAESVRGRIWSWVQAQAPRLEGPVLELGAWVSSPAAWWAMPRTMRPDLAWIGLDERPGVNVDEVGRAEALRWGDGVFGAVVCMEMLEHCWHPKAVIAEAARVLRSGGRMLVTTPFAFPVHNYPSDYWRFTPAAMRGMLAEAGFVEIEVEEAGEVLFQLNDHGEAGLTERRAPMHVFAVGVKP